MVSRPDLLECASADAAFQQFEQHANWEIARETRNLAHTRSLCAIQKILGMQYASHVSSHDRSTHVTDSSDASAGHLCMITSLSTDSCLKIVINIDVN